MTESQTQVLVRIGYVLLAIGYFWVDTKFGAEDLERRFERAQWRRDDRKGRRPRSRADKVCAKG